MPPTCGPSRICLVCYFFAVTGSTGFSLDRKLGLAMWCPRPPRDQESLENQEYRKNTENVQNRDSRRMPTMYRERDKPRTGDAEQYGKSTEKVRKKYEESTGEANRYLLASSFIIIFHHHFASSSFLIIFHRQLSSSSFTIIIFHYQVVWQSRGFD